MDSFSPPSPNSVTVLIVGKGGREHALAWKLAQSPSVSRIFVLPGNAGTEKADKTQNVADIKPNDYEAIVSFAKVNGVGLVVAGPDDAVVDGIEDHFRSSGIPCFAPSRAAAEIEGSKAFAKEFMRRYNIPTSTGESFEYYSRARDYIKHVTRPVVIKASGLAAGKGVILPTSQDEALEALDDIMVYKKFGKEAGDLVVIESYLQGDEISVHTFCDGHTFKSLPAGQDHKRAWADNGPNTGGMGVYTPTTFVTDRDMEMMTKYGPKVIEYNARFGDPEAQSMLPLLSSDTDLCHILLACTSGKLADVQIKNRSGYVCNVVVASFGYPGPYVQGHTIELAPCPEGTLIFHAGTRRETGVLKTAGGRVFTVTASGDTLEEAVKTAYAGVDLIKFDGMYYRKDIASR
ncbi:phosphoribosylamine-glycine ligase [Apiospora rasikravindrae]|uniref:phosphoribosylamine--glycine ligase n=1 Tax=Apiospora rasikravindrae TaxID=990691 RepID=A0ABR1SXJ6_9PEZI